MFITGKYNKSMNTESGLDYVCCLHVFFVNILKYMGPPSSQISKCNLIKERRVINSIVFENYMETTN